MVKDALHEKKEFSSSSSCVAIETDAKITISNGKKANIRKYAISAAADVRLWSKNILKKI